MTVREFLDELSTFADGWDDWNIFVTLPDEEEGWEVVSFSANKLPGDDAGWVTIHISI